MKYLIHILVLISLSTTIYCQKVKNNYPPGTVKIKENFYFDKSEVSNVDYREYCYWIERIFGKNSKEYLMALLDSNIISYKYYKNPKYNEYPVVGISYEQAILYCKWRSDRVYEINLIDAGVIDITQNQNRDNYFTIEKILTNKITIRKSSKFKKIPIPEYRLPTIEEWEYAASGGLDLTKFPYGVDTLLLKQNIPYYKNSSGLVNIKTNEKILPNNFGLINIIGNVAEMVAEKGTAKGCTWAQKFEECEIKNNLIYTKPENWLGFRCCCIYK